MNTNILNIYILLSILPRIVSFVIFILESNVEAHDFELFAILKAKIWCHVFLDIKSAVLTSNPIDFFYAIFSLVRTKEVLILDLCLYRNKHLNRPNIMLIILHPYCAILVPQSELANIPRKVNSLPVFGDILKNESIQYLLFGLVHHYII